MNHVTPSPTVGIGRAGLCTPLGRSTLSTSWAVRASLSSFVDTELTDRRAQPVRASRLEGLTATKTRSERLVELAFTALHDTLADLEATSLLPVPCYIAAPAAGDGGSVEKAALIAALSRLQPTNLELLLPDATFYDHGRAGFFYALAAACQRISDDPRTVALVGAIDSQCDPVTLQWLLDENLVLGDANPDGAIPGEGAGFVLIGQSEGLRMCQLAPLAHLLGCVTAQEPQPFATVHRHPNAAPSTGAGLTTALRMLRLDPECGAQRADRVCSCQPGGAYWGAEFTNAYLRNAALMPEPLTVDSLADTLGDLGAAAGAVQLGLALHGFELADRYGAEARRCLIYGSADTGSIGAAVISRAGGYRPTPSPNVPANREALRTP